MTAYNPVNGFHAASNYDLTTTLLREEWGFDGIVMTDWWATMNDPVRGGEASRHNTAAMVRAQNDLYMVIGNNGAEVNAGEDNTLAALASGTLTINAHSVVDPRRALPTDCEARRRLAGYWNWNIAGLFY